MLAIKLVCMFVFFFL